MSRTCLVALTAITVSLSACGGVPNQFTQSSEVASVSSATPGAEAGTGGAAGSAHSALTAGAPAVGGSPTLPDDMTAPAAGAPDTPPPPVPTRLCIEEQCNGTDDDCDGLIDEGCPVSLSPGFQSQRPSIGDSPGGDAFADSCASDEVLVGLTVAVGAWLDQVTAVCQKYALGVSAEAPYRYTLALGARRSLTAHPATTLSASSELSCQNGMILVGLRISQEHSAYQQASDFIVISQLSIECAEPFLSLSDDEPHVAWKNPVYVGPATGSFATSETWYYTDSIAASDVPSGLHGASGGWVDSIGLTENPLRVLLK